MHGTDNTPTAERLLRLLADLYADQCGVKVTVEIVEGDEEKREPA
jgi:hypothetical protein